MVWDEKEDVSGSKEQHFSSFDSYGWSGAERDSVISFPDAENGYRPSITVANWVTIPNAHRDGLPIGWVAWTEFAGGSPDNYEVHLSMLTMTGGAIGDETLGATWGVSAYPSPSRTVTNFRFSTSLPGPATAQIFSPAGRLIRRLTSASQGSLSWDGRDSEGRLLPPGRYQARVTTSAGVRTIPIMRF